jgi:glycosyltransferase involved in cell wall biosynthesis
MKIAMVSEHASPLAMLGGPDAGGQNVHVAELSRALARKGHEITVYTRRDDPDLPERVAFTAGVTVEHVPAGPAKDIPKDSLLPWMDEFGDYLARRWSVDPPDIVHAHFWMSGLAALAGARGIGVPVFQTFHALGVVKRRYQGANDTSPVERIHHEIRIGREATGVIATCSDEVFELIRLGVPRQRIGVVPCGVDVERFTPKGPRAPRGPRPRLLWLGRLVERKGVDTIIKALPRIPEAELVIAGGPPRSDLPLDPEASRLMELARTLRAAGRVTWLGRVAHDRVPALIRSADVVVCTPWYEPFGIVPLEAMACGVPVVVSAVGGMTDTVVHGATGIHVPPRRPDVLALAVRSLLADPLRREAYGIAGVDRARSRYSWDRVAEETLALYEPAGTHARAPVRAPAGEPARHLVEQARVAGKDAS